VREPAIDEIKKFCKGYLSDWKCPKEFIFLTRAPEKSDGKTMKRGPGQTVHEIKPPRG